MEVEEYGRIAAAEDAHWWYRNTRALAAALLEPWLAPDGRFLDAGCGPGGNGAWLTATGTVVGVDLSRTAVELCHTRHPSVLVAQGDVGRLPVAGGAFDAVLDLTVLTSVPDDAVAAAELARVVRPGGAVLFMEPAFEALRRGHDAVVHARRRYRLPELEALARTAGLEVVRSTYAYSFLAPAALALGAAWRLRRRPAAGAASDVTRTGGGGLFGRLAQAERRWLERRRVPFGTSALVVAAKPG